MATWNEVKTPVFIPLPSNRTITSVLNNKTRCNVAIIKSFLDENEIEYLDGKLITNIQFATEDQLLDMMKRHFHPYFILNQACVLGSLSIVQLVDYTNCTIIPNKLSAYTQNNYKPVNFESAFSNVKTTKNAFQILDFLYEKMFSSLITTTFISNSTMNNNNDSDNGNDTVNDSGNGKNMNDNGNSNDNSNGNGIVNGIDNGHFNVNSKNLQQLLLLTTYNCIRSTATLTWFKNRGLFHFNQGKSEKVQFWNKILEYGDLEFLDICEKELGILDEDDAIEYLRYCLHNGHENGYYWLIKKQQQQPPFYSTEGFTIVVECFLLSRTFFTTCSLFTFQRIYPFFKENIIDYLEKKDEVMLEFYCSPEIYYWVHKEANIPIPIEKLITFKLSSILLRNQIINYLFQQNESLFDELSDELLLTIIHAKIQYNEFLGYEFYIFDKIIIKNTNPEKLSCLLNRMKLYEPNYPHALSSVLWYFKNGGNIIEPEVIFEKITNWKGYNTDTFKELLKQTNVTLSQSVLSSIYNSIHKIGLMYIIHLVKETQNPIYFPSFVELVKMGFTNEDFTFLFTFFKFKNFFIPLKHDFDYFIQVKDISQENIRNLVQFMNPDTYFKYAIKHNHIQLLKVLLTFRKNEIHIDMSYIRKRIQYNDTCIPVLIEHFYEEWKDQYPFLYKKYRILFDFIQYQKQHQQRHQPQLQEMKVVSPSSSCSSSSSSSLSPPPEQKQLRNTQTKKQPHQNNNDNNKSKRFKLS